MHAVWVVDSDGHKEACIRWGSRSHVKDNFEGEGRPVAKYWDYLPWAVQKRLSRSRCRLGYGLRWVQESTIRWGVIIQQRWTALSRNRWTIAIARTTTLKETSFLCKVDISMFFHLIRKKCQQEAGTNHLLGQRVSRFVRRMALALST